MSYLHEQKRIGDYLIKVFQDDSPESPRSWDNLGTMVCFHKRYDLGDKTDYRSEDYDSWEELKNGIEENEGEIVILPLYLYDHSGITISTSSFSCQWDSGQIGFIFVSKHKIEKEGIDITKVEEYLKGEVETYDQYLRGDVYGYKVFKVSTCSLGHEHEEEIESCWGFYGDEECMTEAEGVLKYHQEDSVSV
jgi:hypothetical protein